VGCTWEHLGVCRIYLIEGNKYLSVNKETALKHFQDAVDEIAVAERHASALGLKDFRDKIRKVKKKIQAYIIRGDSVPTSLISEVARLETEALNILRKGGLEKICPTCLSVEHVAEL